MEMQGGDGMMETLWVEKGTKWIEITYYRGSIIKTCRVEIPETGRILHECKHHVIFIREVGSESLEF